MLPKELRKLHEERHKLLLEEAKQRYGSSDGIQYSEAVWENTLSELTSGEHDSVLGLRFFVAELLGRIDRQEFIDKTAIRLCRIATEGTSKDAIKQYARIAYDQAEAMWRERHDRKNRNADEIPF